MKPPAQLKEPKAENAVQLKLSLCQWLLSLPEGSPALHQLDEIRHGGNLPERAEEEPLLGLKEVCAAVGYKHPTSLWRLGVRDVAETWGGVPRYRKSVVLEYLKSDKCQQRRRKRKEAAQKERLSKK